MRLQVSEVIRGEAPRVVEMTGVTLDDDQDIADMRDRIAASVGVAPERVNVKAKTAERLGPVGQGLSIEARAVVLLVKPSAV